ncbi:polyprenol reductase isoform X1 [Halyomorpha halys]|uniref:polyprenol reductase isoform X1 n=2 Tax=Halyomorpha halys TaxID=286706 RepID=UPI0006D4D50F|nr:polyprenol reductase [Halyomorpha halys]
MLNLNTLLLTYNLNYIKIIFLLLAATHFLLGIFVNWFEKNLPSHVIIMYKYGKLNGKKQSFTPDYVPKSWFRHFYVFASIFSMVSFLLLFLTYFNYIYGLNEDLRIILSFFGGSQIKPTVSADASFIAMGLMAIHCCRRFYETHFVSVFSDAKMNIGVYFVGHFHYFGAILAILCEAPGILNRGDFEAMNYDFSLRQILGVIVFLWANKTQFDSAVILGQLRKNEKGKISSTKHYIPRGKYFELVSCPHLMCEVVIYLCLWAILWGNTNWPYVTLWVIANQIECGLLSHWWYKETFKNYPKERKAIIPYIL